MDGWKPSEDPEEVTVEYWDALTVDKQKILHYYRNAYQIGLLPERLDGLGDDGIKNIGEVTFILDEWKDYGSAAAHNVGTTGNIDYRGIDERVGQQAIYDTNGKLVTTPENMGTYDYEEPLARNFYIKHLNLDVEPWLIWGNSPQDTTTKEERVCALNENWKGELALFLYTEYDYESCE